MEPERIFPENPCNDRRPAYSEQWSFERSGCPMAVRSTRIENPAVFSGRPVYEGAPTGPLPMDVRFTVGSFLKNTEGGAVYAAPPFDCRPPSGDPPVRPWPGSPSGPGACADSGAVKFSDGPASPLLKMTRNQKLTGDHPANFENRDHQGLLGEQGARPVPAAHGTQPCSPKVSFLPNPSSGGVTERTAGPIMEVTRG